MFPISNVILPFRDSIHEPTLSLASLPVRLDHATRMILLSGIFFFFSMPVSDDALCLFNTVLFSLLPAVHGQVQKVDLVQEAFESGKQQGPQGTDHGGHRRALGNITWLSAHQRLGVCAEQTGFRHGQDIADPC